MKATNVIVPINTLMLRMEIGKKEKQPFNFK
jgi:hypothetical protein